VDVKLGGRVLKGFRADAVRDRAASRNGKHLG
jgi:hypothetical protein